MSSLFEKARVAVLSRTCNALLDRVVDTLEGYKQYIRDLEVALAELRAAADEAAGTYNGHKRNKVRAAGEMAQHAGRYRSAAWR